MSDITTKQIEIVLKGRDDGSLNLLGQAERRVSSLAAALKQGGDIGELSGVKKFGKNIGEFLGLGDRSAAIKGNADTLRTDAAVKLRDEYEKINSELATGQATELRIAKLMDLKQQAAERYKKTLNDINTAEANAIRGSGGGITRGIAVAGGTVAAIQAAGKIAEAWDAANQKLEEGKIKAGEWTAEFAKGLPILGGVVKSAESLLMVVTGTASQLREVNREAAELDKKQAWQTATKKAAGELGAELGKLNQSDRQKVIADAKERLDKINKLREQAMANGTIGQLADGFKKGEAEVIRKRESDLAEIEAKEREARAKKLQDVEDRLEDNRKAVQQERTKIEIASLVERGRLQAAAELQINSEANARRDELLKKRAALNRQTGLSDSQRIALNNGIDAELQANEAARAAQLGSASRDALRRVDRGINENNAALFAAKQAQRERENQLRIAAINTQFGARTSFFDGRGQTGFFNQSKQIESSNVKIAENTKSTVDELKRLPAAIAQNVFGALGGIASF